MTEALVGSQLRRVWIGATTLFGALLLAACQSAIPKAPPPAAPPPAPVVKAPTGEALPEDQARNRVALLVPTTGPNSAVGQSIANAATLALLDTGGRAVRVTTYDTGPSAAAATARALADGNRLILGPLLAEDVRAVAGSARGAGVPVIGFSNDAAASGDGVFLMGFSPAQSIERVVHFAASKGIRRFAGLTPSGAYGRNASNTLLRAAEGAGGSVAALQSYDRNPAALSAAVQKLGGGYEAVLIADGTRIALQAAPLVRKHAGQARILGTELWNAETGGVAQPALAGAWFASVSDTMFRQLATKYRARFGRAPSRLASLGYDAVLLAVRIGADWKVGAPFPVARLTEAGGFGGVDGAFRFGRDGIAERALEVRQAGPGGGTVVSPAPRGF